MLDTAIGYLPHLTAGALLTLQVSLGGLAGGLLIGVITAPLALYGAKPIRLLITAYVAVMRGLPELLIIFLVFYGGTVLLTTLAGRYVEVNALSSGIFALSVVSGAYFSEILRAALLSVPEGQSEAARALGLGPVSTFRLVVLPQMVRHALPGAGNQWLILLKDSALVSVVGLEELMRKAVIAAGATHDALTFYVIAALFYIAITAVSTVGLSALERRFPAIGATS